MHKKVEHEYRLAQCCSSQFRRSALFGTVEIKVDASAQAPGCFSASQHVLAQTLQADSNGNFPFSFSPRLPIPGTRYEVSLVSAKAGVTNDARLTLYQQ